ncbi:NCA2-domain-containing protein [Lophiostoma macrostomum CBS 122681]|uniref:NCA2-domain-containing protein n=1 Tax=Lophiostoma macrostomum CBS 122681 TaxID=1314788 RepID=A0A6A6TMJ3_9PLEO|nr:NCA2-domain-containing protein [Lophiostoma macrostomum CBS 122681]
MSFVVDQVRLIDSRLDQLQLSKQQPGDSFCISSEEAHDPGKATRIAQLQRLIKSLSTTSSSKATLVPVPSIKSVLDEAQLCTSWQPFAQDASEARFGTPQRIETSYEHELEWLLLSKATAQAYGSVLNTILEGALPLEDDIWYWQDIASTYRYAGLYSVQTSPLRLWTWSKDIYTDVRRRGGAIANGWSQFYGLVKDAVQERSIADIQRRVVSPLALAQAEGKQKAKALRKIRLRSANALGLLLGEGLSYESMHGEDLRTFDSEPTRPEDQHKWKGTIARSIALMDAVLRILDEGCPGKFDDAVAAITEEDQYFAPQESSREATTTGFLKPADVAQRLHDLLTRSLSKHASSYTVAVHQNGKPSPLIRYWLPASLLLISSTTILRIAVNRKEQILTWVREFGQTVKDFWLNWVIEPSKKVIGTIRHDEGSEVSIMSKRSLEGDRASLERMVVDFAVAHPNDSPMNESQIADIRAKVREGDLTTVLKAYEKDIQKPIMGAITGSLVSALLIQIQKTKVDVEVAMSGIDSILKSQELLFGFIGLTPGVLVTIGLYRWLNGVFNNRASMEKWATQGQLVLILRNIDRILVAARRTTNDYGEISYEDQGLLLFEIHRFRQSAQAIFPRRMFQDLLQDLDELSENRNGLQRQKEVVERIRWAYAKYI